LLGSLSSQILSLGSGIALVGSMAIYYLVNNYPSKEFTADFALEANDDCSAKLVITPVNSV